MKFLLSCGLAFVALTGCTINRSYVVYPAWSITGGITPPVNPAPTGGVYIQQQGATSHVWVTDEKAKWQQIN